MKFLPFSMGGDPFSIKFLAFSITIYPLQHDAEGFLSYRNCINHKANPYYPNSNGLILL
jgi:hypothetical protein